MGTVTLRLPPRPAHVRTARLVASAMARRCGVDEGVLDDVRLAVGEACARAVMLHERHALDQPVTVELSDGGAFSVTVTDCLPSVPGVCGVTSASEVHRTAWHEGEPGLLPFGGAGAFAPGQAALEKLVVPVDVDEILDDGLEWVEPERLGLAVLAGVVDDLTVERAEDGTRVRMSWPVLP